MPLGFESGAWLFLAAGAFVLGHLVVLAYFLRGNAGRSEPALATPPDFTAEADPGRPTDAPPESVGSGRSKRSGSDELPPIERDQVVQCPHCGVENAAEFRYCRFCVGELTGGRTVADASSASRDGQAF
ncbi:hypothetical protein L593_09645 [Salinarchaeum sp. Harcht-Bsk1]|uniref:DUF7577 domain-containing protein n=1 Tax=Salinarchaeum sp. Harcht-Bsk1 TaxID=1333523 RepID=UPI0003422FD5|nr:hypothetical protein [Salinarchaeum sp. Harcht-Bsk1]AGN01874.1 hypothetical protein L593_09645 [Salinarchaeum sp. Harcht-Bsk1]